MGFVAWKPDPLTTNLIAPAASGSEASALWSPRTFQPFGACASAGAMARSAAKTNPAKCFISVPPQEMTSTNHTPVPSLESNLDFGTCSARLQAGILDSSTRSPEGERYKNPRLPHAPFLTALAGRLRPGLSAC